MEDMPDALDMPEVDIALDADADIDIDIDVDMELDIMGMLLDMDIMLLDMPLMEEAATAMLDMALWYSALICSWGLIIRTKTQRWCQR